MTVKVYLVTTMIDEIELYLNLKVIKVNDKHTTVLYLSD